MVDGVSMADKGIISQWARQDTYSPQHIANLVKDTVLFSRKVSKPSVGMTAKQVQNVIDPILMEMKTRPGVTVLEKQMSLPPEIKTYLKDKGGANDIVVATVFENRVYLVAENIEDRHEAVTALLHEVMGHFCWIEEWEGDEQTIIGTWTNEQNGETIEFTIRKADYNETTGETLWDLYQDDERWTEPDGPFNSIPEAKHAAEQVIEDGVEDMLMFSEDMERNTQSQPYPRHDHPELLTPGGKNYKELLLTLPIDPGGRKFEEWVKTESKGELPTDTPYARLPAHMQKILRDRFESLQPRPFYHQHWRDVPNVIAHVRFNERIDVDGKKILFLEEVQSDWHQTGRKRGYYDPKIPREIIYRGPDDAPKGMKLEQGSNGIWEISGNGFNSGGHKAPEDAIRAYYRSKAGAVPLAPFQKTWPMLIIKRMVRYAAENDFDRIAWTPGEF